MNWANLPSRVGGAGEIKPTTQVTTGKNQSHLPSLDGVRLFAIAAVVVHHSLSTHHSSVVLRMLAIQEGNGLGVPLFLILSGFLLTGILLNTKDKADRYKTFMSRRAARILPLYFAYLCAAVVLTWSTLGYLPQHLWVYILFLQGYLPTAAENTRSVLPLYHFWTLGVQEQFYFLWPLLVWGCARIKQVRHLCWTGIGLSFVARLFFVGYLGSHGHLTELLPFRVGEMCFGGLLATEFRVRTRLSIALRYCTIPAVSIYALWAWHGLSFTSPRGFVLGLPLVTILCGCLLLQCLDPSTIVYRFFSTATLATMGKKYSYGIYIFHVLTLQVLSQTKELLGSMRYPVVLSLAAFVVWAAYNGFESRFLVSAKRTQAHSEKPMICPECESEHTRRIKWLSVLTQARLPYLGHFSWECLSCGSLYNKSAERTKRLEGRVLPRQAHTS